MSMINSRKELEEISELSFEITEELVMAIGNFSETEGSKVNELQPPSSVVRAMATAAAQVLIAFERGYQMD